MRRMAAAEEADRFRETFIRRMRDGDTAAGSNGRGCWLESGNEKVASGVGLLRLNIKNDYSICDKIQMLI